MSRNENRYAMRGCSLKRSDGRVTTMKTNTQRLSRQLQKQGYSKEFSDKTAEFHAESKNKPQDYIPMNWE